MDPLELLAANYRWAVIPLLGALIGWGTNWLALKMLFHPRLPRLGVQGLVPKRRGEISGKVARTIERELLTTDDILEAIERLDLKALAVREVEAMVAERLRSEALRDYAPLKMLHGQIIRAAQRAVTREVEKGMDRFMDTMGTHLSEEMDLVALIEEKMALMDDQRIEEIIFEVANRELRHIVHLGALLGFVVGCAQVLFLHFTGGV